MPLDLPVTPVPEEAASGRVKDIFDEIRTTTGTGRVPPIFRIMAHLPLYLETSWQRFKFAFFRDGHLDRRTKWMLALAVSATNNSRPMIMESTERLKALGTTDREIAELMAVVDVTNGFNKVMKAARVDHGE